MISMRFYKAKQKSYKSRTGVKFEGRCKYQKLKSSSPRKMEEITVCCSHFGFSHFGEDGNRVKSSRRWISRRGVTEELKLKSSLLEAAWRQLDDDLHSSAFLWVCGSPSSTSTVQVWEPFITTARTSWCSFLWLGTTLPSQLQQTPLGHLPAARQNTPCILQPRSAWPGCYPAAGW